MSTNVRQFNPAVLGFKHEIEQELVEFHEKIAIEIHTGAVYHTAVKIGRARGGWQITINVTPRAKTGKLDKDGSATVEAGIAALAGLEPYQVVIVSNNVDYIIYLDGGSSQQFPEGIIDPVIAVVEAQFT